MIPLLALTVGEPLVLSAGSVGEPTPSPGFEDPPWPQWERADSAAALTPGAVYRSPSYGPVIYALEDDWRVQQVRGSTTEITRGPVGVGTPETACRRGLSNVGVLADPPRVVLRCPDVETMGLIHSVLWTPEAWFTWDQTLTRNTLSDAGGLAHPVLPERGDNAEAPESGLGPALLDTYTRWVDLERGRLFTSEPLDVVHMSIRGIPEQGFLRRLPDEVLYWGDFEAGTLRVVEGVVWCPGQLVERDRDGDRVLLHCTSQPEPQRYRFDIEWGVVIDVGDARVWSFEGTPERVLGDTVVLSERASSAAESVSEHGGLSQVVLGP